jgi:hypothetical protein
LQLDLVWILAVSYGSFRQGQALVAVGNKSFPVRTFSDHYGIR